MIRAGSLLLMVSMLTLAACDQQGQMSDELDKKTSNLIHLGASMESNGNEHEAEKLYLKAKEASPSAVEPDLALANLYHRQGDPKKSKALLKEAEQQDPGHPQLNAMLGKLAIEQGNGEKALKYFSEGLKRAPEDTVLLNGKGIALDMLLRHEEAQKVYTEALAVAGPEERTQFINNLALSHIMAGNYVKAISLLSSVPDVEKQPVLRQNLALAYGLKGDMKKARELAKKDIDAKQLEENMRFYQNYRNSLILRKSSPQLKPQP